MNPQVVDDPPARPATGASAVPFDRLAGLLVPARHGRRSRSRRLTLMAPNAAPYTGVFRCRKL